MMTSTVSVFGRLDTRVALGETAAGHNNTTRARIFKRLWSPGIDSKE
jgi:hypothetical protein